ncbi:MAG: phosphopantothenoylcysteine decarboxylase/phosphopantothenate synthase [Rhodanobacteraceae bacterium]|jgi:phosphopantothenoylcysteine decarboxylase/phosphopantothenate--cysteine ligase|nr:MAG: phosphopantothenoylcysteine decarboxylase/phosphopantothenate synthase [Rhodanobacteraceae bacterium]
MSPDASLAGLKVVIDAGPTYEDIDPVRFLGNRSSGKMGFAVAAAAAAAGAEVTLIAGPVSLPTPAGVARRVDVRSALQMRDAVMRAIPGADIFIATAAVADWRVAEYSSRKIKKGPSGAPVLELVENPDILAEVAALDPRPFVVGFAAETDHVAEHARAKLERKQLDMLAANHVDETVGIGADDNALDLIWPGGDESLPRASKPELAKALVARIAARYRAQAHA